MSSSLVYLANSRLIRTVLKKKKPNKFFKFKDKIKIYCIEHFKNYVSKNQYCGNGQWNDMENKFFLNSKQVSSHL